MLTSWHWIPDQREGSRNRAHPPALCRGRKNYRVAIHIAAIFWSAVYLHLVAVITNYSATVITAERLNPATASLRGEEAADAEGQQEYQRHPVGA